VLILVAANSIGSDDGASGYFRADQVWLYITILTAAYMVSRGLAKSANRDRAPAVGTLAIVLGLVALLVGSVFTPDHRQAAKQPSSRVKASQESMTPRLVPRAATGASTLRAAQDRLAKAERRAGYARRRKNAWQRRARRAERALKQARARTRRASRR